MSTVPSYIDMPVVYPSITNTQDSTCPPPYYPSLPQSPPYCPPQMHRPSAPSEPKSNSQFGRQVKEHLCELHERIDLVEDEIGTVKTCLACSWCCFLSACTGLMCGM